MRHNLSPQKSPLPRALSCALSCALLASVTLACEGGEEPPALYIGGVEATPAAGTPADGTPAPPAPDPALREDCGPLLPAARALFTDPAPSSPASLLKICKNCHNAPSPSNNFVLAYQLDNPTLSPQDITVIYQSVSPFLTVGEGAASPITQRLSDGHSNVSNYAPDSPEVTAMIAWINALTACP